jgi:hypothetical protein
VITGLNVTQQDTPALGVKVAAGDAFIAASGGYPYMVWSDASQNISLSTADGSNPRIDVIVAYVDLTVVSSASSNNPNAWVLAKVDGTPAGSPSAPNNAAIQSAIGASNPYIILAQVAVAAGATTITNSNITDVRVLGENFLRGRYQSNTTNSVETSLKLQRGWGFIQGDGANRSLQENVTFPTAFSGIPTVFVSTIGFKTGSDPSDEGDTGGVASMTFRFVAYDTSTTTTSIQVIRSIANPADGTDPGVLGATNRYMYSWLAIGAG